MIASIPFNKVTKKALKNPKTKALFGIRPNSKNSIYQGTPIGRIVGATILAKLIYDLDEDEDAPTPQENYRHCISRFSHRWERAFGWDNHERAKMDPDHAEIVK